jgi:hypothetical protein
MLDYYTKMIRADRALTKAIQFGASDARIAYLRERLEFARIVWKQEVK